MKRLDNRLRVLCRILLAFLLLIVALPARAETPRDELLRLVPENVGFCLVIQDLRGHSDAFLRSPFAKKLWESPIGMAISSAPEQKKLVEFEAHLKAGLGVTGAQLRDDVFGDAVVFAYRPGSPGKEDQEQGLMLVHARDAQLLAEIAARFNDIQKQSGDLKEVLVREHHGVKYNCRVERKGENFAYLHGPLLAFSTREEMIQQVIDLEQKQSKEESAVQRHLRRLDANQSLAALWINPRAFDAAFEQKAKQLKGAEATFLQTVQGHWKAVDGIALSAKVKESELSLALALSAKADLLPAAVRAVFAGDAKRSDLWRAFPDDALLAVGGRIDAAAWNDFLSGLLPEEQRKAVREASRRFAGPALGKNIATDVLPLLGPDWGVCVLAPRAEDKGWFPHTIWALRIQPGGIDHAMLNVLNSLALLAVFAYNGSHPDQITFHALEKLEGGYLSNDQEFPAGFQPAFTLKNGYLILASSPIALDRFSLSQTSAGKKQNPKSEVRNSKRAGSHISDFGIRASETGKDIPLFRMSLHHLAQYLNDHKSELGDHIAKKEQVSKADAARKLEALIQIFQLFNRVELTQRSGSGKLSMTLNVQTAYPLGDAAKK
jgi:hypothetical protein